MTTLQTLAWVTFVLLFLNNVRHLDLSEFANDKRRQHIVFGAMAALFFLWLFRAGIYDGLDVHFLWLTALSLTLGFRWALVASSVALLGVTVVGLEEWHMFGVNAWLNVVAPIAMSYLVYIISFHKIPRHVFIYIFVCAFFPGALVIALQIFLLGGYYYIDDIYSWQVVYDNYILLIPLMLFPEGLLNGMTMTLFIIYKPEWVYSFHDKFYIDGK